MAKDAAKKRISWSAAWREAAILIAAHRGRLAIGFVLMVVGRAAGMVLPYSSKILVDEIYGKQHWEWLTPLALAVSAAALIDAGCGYALAQILGVAAQRAIADLRKAVQAHVLRLPTSFFDASQSGQLISRIMTDAEGVRNLVGNGIVQLVGGTLTAVAATIALFWLNWRLTFAVLATLAAFAVGMAFAFKVLRPIFRERGKINAEVTGRLGETLGGIRVVKAYVAEPREEAAFALGIGRLFTNVRRSITGVSAMAALATAVLGLAGGLMIAIGGAAVHNGQMSLGEFFSFIFFTGLVAAPVTQMASIGTQISEAFAGLDRIRELRSHETEDQGDAKRVACPPLRGEVALDRVWFEYRANEPVLKDISFVAAAGTTTALVGPSGSGKSTLVGLIAAFHRPQRGRVLVDGLDLTDLRLGDYRRQLGVVLQDSFLFDGSIADNISFARAGATRDEVLAAARLAHCDDFAMKQEKGYDTIVGERGVRLSGGQRQRVSIARALLADPRILILDEATSSLDSESEWRIQEALGALRRGRTTFVIAHRLSTIRSADCILVLDAGCIVERGTHAELLAAVGLYRKLHDRQHALEQERYVNPGEELLVPDVRRSPVVSPR